MNSDEEKSLLTELQNSENQAFEIGAAELNPPAELMNATNVPTPGDAPAPVEVNPASLDLPNSLDLSDAAVSDEPFPNENPNPELAVEEMLASALLPENELATSEEPLATLDLSPMNVPSFQLHLDCSQADSALKEKVKAAVSGEQIRLSDAIWAHANPVLSQLSEFQLMRLWQVLRPFGIPLRATMQLPDFAPTEEDLALGSLSAVPEPKLTPSEGAPSVALARGEEDVILYGGEDLPSFPIQQTLGIVSAHRSIARRFFREDELSAKMQRELLALPGRTASHLPPSRLQLVFRDLFTDLKIAGLQKGGNAVLGLRIEAFPESTNLDPNLEQMRLVAFGTAAVVEKL